MRIHVANPNASQAMTRTIAAAARRAASPGTEIVATCSASGPASIEGHLDGARAVPGLLAAIEREAGADAHVVACFDDTGLDAARCVAAAPVIGIGEAACLMATQIAERFAIVTAAPVSVPVLEANLRRQGLRARCAGVRAAGVAVLEIAEEPVARAARDAAAAHPEAAIVLGCAGMADLAARLARELDRPVIDGVGAAVVLAEGVVRLGLRTARGGGWARPAASG